MIRKIFQNNFLQLKCKNHLTQREIAEKLGYPISTISNWCAGRMFPSADAIDDICDLFKITPSELFEEIKE